MTAPPFELTVLICTHNRVELLSRVIASLNAARQPSAASVHLFVVANACTDGTHAYLANYRTDAGKLPLIWTAESTPGKSHALNRALPQIRTGAVAFVDDDHRVDADYLVNACTAFATYPHADLFCGRILPDWDGTEPAWVHDTSPWRIYPLPVPRYERGNAAQEITVKTGGIPGGGNLLARAEWLDRVGPFATDYGPVGHDLGGAEDLQWVIRALKLGARVQYVPDIVQHHYVDVARLKLPYLMEKAFKRSASTIRLRGDPTAGMPRYIYRKLAEYLLSAIVSIREPKRRFFFVRVAACLGEMQGYRLLARDNRRAATLESDRH